MTTKIYEHKHLSSSGAREGKSPRQKKHKRRKFVRRKNEE